MIYSSNVLEVIDRGLMTRDVIEKVAIGSAMCFDACWQKARPIVSDRLFSDERNKFIWGLLREMKEKGMDTDVVTMWQYALDKYPEIQNPAELAAYICEVTIIVAFKGYDKVISELLRFFALGRKKHGW